MEQFENVEFGQNSGTRSSPRQLTASSHNALFADATHWRDHISHNNSAHGQEAQAKIKELLFNYIHLKNVKLIFHTKTQFKESVL